MAKAGKISDWLEHGNEEQFLWTEQYLRRKGLYTAFLTGQTKYQQLANHLENVARGNNGLYYLSKMKGSWSVKKSRKKSGRKSYSFQLQPSTYEALQKLSKNCTLTSTLEDLINDTYQYKRDLQSANDQKLKAKIAELEKVYGRKPRKQKFRKTILDWSMLETQLKEAKELTHQTQVECDKLLQELCQYLVIMDDAGIKPGSITMAQKAAAIDRYESVRKISESELAALLGSQPQLNLDLD